ncbi:MAG: glycosyltransferase family 4 protein [Alteromonadaceae bacterium]|nr:glycosyltransferase family 4 protein [Alteromonadaceae bacterium]
MKILLSAYACEPYKGSEPAVGWNWLLESCKTKNDIWVLTRNNNRDIIEKYFQENEIPNNLTLIYYDFPKKLMFLKKIFGIYFYYLFWQIGAFLKVRKLNKSKFFDQVHHVTFATIRQPSFMALLGVPFIYGPAGGGESPPYHLIRNFPQRPKQKELIRMLANIWVKLDPFMHFTFFSANKIVVTSEQTKNLVARFYRHKVVIKLAIAQSNGIVARAKICTQKDKVKLLFVGRFEYWKGIHLCIKSLVELKSNYKELNARLTLIGEGPYKNHLQKLAKQIGVDLMIDWLPWMEQSKLDGFYSSHDLFIFPSLHDSGGMVVLEAMSASMPVICLNSGGPSTIVTESSGEVIDVQLSEEEICKKIALHISIIIKAENYPIYCQNARIRSQELTWEKLVTGLL